jgi:hypothetical protein
VGLNFWNWMKKNLQRKKNIGSVNALNADSFILFALDTLEINVDHAQLSKEDLKERLAALQMI